MVRSGSLMPGSGPRRAGGRAATPLGAPARAPHACRHGRRGRGGRRGREPSIGADGSEPAPRPPRPPPTWPATRSTPCPRAPSPSASTAAREGRPLRVKLGMDPTAPDVHLGHTVVLQKLREFQDAGHTVVLIIGDYTARVGDPSGRSATRPVLSGRRSTPTRAPTSSRPATSCAPTSASRSATTPSGSDMRWRSSSASCGPVTVAQMLERDDFAKRWAAGGPISMLELLYPVLQGYDSVAVRADVELGGTDQKFNLLMGRAIQQAYGQPPQACSRCRCSWGPTASARCRSRSATTSASPSRPRRCTARRMRSPTRRCAAGTTCCSASAPPAGAAPRDAKRALARALVARFAGGGRRRGRRGRTSTASSSPRGCPRRSRRRSSRPSNGTVHLPEVIAGAFGGSRSEARRTLAQGGVRLDGEPLAADALDLPAAASTARSCRSASAVSGACGLPGAEQAWRHAASPCRLAARWTAAPERLPRAGPVCATLLPSARSGIRARRTGRSPRPRESAGL